MRSFTIVPRSVQRVAVNLWVFCLPQLGSAQSLWVATRTGNWPTDGSTARICISAPAGTELDVAPFLGKQHHLKQGGANVFIARGVNVDPQTLTPGSIKICMKPKSYYYTPPNNDWSIHDILVWREFGDDVAPLAMESELNPRRMVLSPGQAVSLSLVARGDETTIIERLVLVTVTDTSLQAGTDARLRLDIVTQGVQVASYAIPKTPQEDFKRGQGNYHIFPVLRRFTKASLQPNAISVSIDNTDEWTPAAIFLFGATGNSGRPTTLVPLVRAYLNGTSLGTNQLHDLERLILPIHLLTTRPVAPLP